MANCTRGHTQYLPRKFTMRCCEDLKQHGDVTDGAVRTDACLG